MKGWVYVISNVAMPGIVKVGYSMKDPDSRADELGHTGSPHPYLVDYDVLVDEPREVERAVHRQLRDKREGKEWFRCSIDEAVASVKSVVGERGLLERFKRVDRETAERLVREQEAQRAIEAEHAKRQTVIEEQRRQVREGYEKKLEAASQPSLGPFETFALCFLGCLLALLMFVAKISDGALILSSLVGALFLSLLVRHLLVERAKKSPKYVLLLSEQEEALKLKPEETLQPPKPAWPYRPGRDYAIEQIRAEIAEETRKHTSK